MCSGRGCDAPGGAAGHQFRWHMVLVTTLRGDVGNIAMALTGGAGEGKHGKTLGCDKGGAGRRRGGGVRKGCEQR